MLVSCPDGLYHQIFLAVIHHDFELYLWMELEKCAEFGHDMQAPNVTGT